MAAATGKVERHLWELPMSVPLCLSRPALNLLDVLKSMPPVAYPTPRACRLGAELWEELQAARADMEAAAHKTEEDDDDL